MAFLETAGTILSLANSAKSLFGGGGSSEGASLKKQLAWNLREAREYPTAQVEGLRAAGLNPMLAVGKGIDAPPPLTSSPGKDQDISTAKQLAAAQSMALASQAELNRAQTDNVKADTLDKLEKPALTKADVKLKGAQGQAQETLAAWQRQMEVTEGWNTKVKITENYSKKLMYELDKVNLGNRQKAEIKKLMGEAQSAKTKGELDAKYAEIERIIGMGGEAVGAVTGAVANTAKAIFGNKPKTIIQKAPNITIRR
ncbi:MAG: hypothetical protein [Microviridae sp.]|nr:MAG: hypothetical protein [Microviridae sp.]